MISPILMFAVCVPICPVARAQEAMVPPPRTAPVTGRVFTVDAAVREVIRNNPRLSAASLDVVAARSGVRAARPLVNPSFVVTPAFTSGGADEAVLFQQPLELNGTRTARAGIAGAQLRLREAEVAVTLRSLVFETRLAYYELARAQETLALTRDVLTNAEEFDRIARRQVEVGTRPGIELAQTGLEASRAKQLVTLAESQVATASVALNTVMGRDADETIGAVAPLLSATIEGIDIPSRDELIRQALAARSEITAEEAVGDRFRQEARLVRAEGRPDLAPQFRVGGGFSTAANNAGFGVAVTLPLLDYGSRRGRIRQAEESARAQTDRATSARRQVRQEVEQAFVRLRAAETVSANYRGEILERTERLLQASRTGFAAGATSLLTVLEAQRTYRTVQTDYLNALLAQAQARAALDRAVGTVPADLTNTPATTNERTAQ
ncbi:MAG: TolC family protein [Akkermansiaceae bacterium]|nr:TolC family protein [Armatimonadota bacterium]